MIEKTIKKSPIPSGARRLNSLFRLHKCFFDKQIYPNKEDDGVKLCYIIGFLLQALSQSSISFLKLKVFRTNKMKSTLVLLILGLFAPLLISAKIFNECSLTRELRRLGVPNHELADWVCIAKYESTFNTKAVGKLNGDGSWDWGLFQINDRYWCKADGKPSSNICGVQCNSLLSDDISRILKCSQKVKKAHGWSGWVAWQNKCQGDKPDISKCN